MTFGHTVRVSITIPLLLIAAACVPQDGTPKAAASADPSAAAQQSSAAALPPAPQAPASPATPAAPKKIITDLTAPRSSIGTATYRCGNGGMISIQSFGTSLRVAGPDGVSEEFIASPANQTSRYQAAATHDAIVIDGREALFMKRGSTPQTCRR